MQGFCARFKINNNNEAQPNVIGDIFLHNKINQLALQYLQFSK